MLKDHFNRVVEIKRPITISNGFGGVTTTWEIVSEIECLIDFVNGEEKLVGSQHSEKTTHILLALAGYDVRPEDIITETHIIEFGQRYSFGENLNFGSTVAKVFRVVYVDEPFGKHAEILLEYVGVDNV